MMLMLEAKPVLTPQPWDHMLNSHPTAGKQGERLLPKKKALGQSRCNKKGPWTHQGRFRLRA